MVMTVCAAFVMTMVLCMEVFGNRRVVELWLDCEKLSTGFSGVVSGWFGFF